MVRTRREAKTICRTIRGEGGGGGSTEEEIDSDEEDDESEGEDDEVPDLFLQENDGYESDSDNEEVTIEKTDPNDWVMQKGGSRGTSLPHF